MSSQSRPLDSGRRDALGRTIRVSGAVTGMRADAPPPPLELTDEMVDAVRSGPQVLMSAADLDRVRGLLTDEQRAALDDVHVIPVEIDDDEYDADVDDDDDSWDADIEPDESDYTIAAEDAIRFAGLERAGVKAAWWTSDGPSDALIGLQGRAGISDLESDYFSPEVAEQHQSMLAAHPDLADRTIAFEAYSTRNDMASATSQYVSIPLDYDEIEAVLDHLEQHPNPDLDFAGDRLRYWAGGNPKEMQRCFGFTSPHEEWQRMSDAVAEVHPHLGTALAFADRLVADANQRYRNDCDHIGSEEWQREQHELRNG